MQAHCHYIAVKDFAESTAPSKCKGSASVSAVFVDLFRLYAVHGIWTNAADFTAVSDGSIVAQKNGNSNKDLQSITNRIDSDCIFYIRWIQFALVFVFFSCDYFRLSNSLSAQSKKCSYFARVSIV